MNNLSIIIHQNQNLFELLKEIKLDQQYNLVHVNSSIEEIIDKLKTKNKEYLVISNQDKIECDNKKLILINKPIKISNLLEKISLLFVKNKYSITSNISIGKYKVNLNSRQISLNNNFLNLTEKELELIMYLFNSKKEKKSSEIRKDVWGHSKGVETHTVETHIYRLRKKINEKFKDQNFLIYNDLGYKIL